MLYEVRALNLEHPDNQTIKDMTSDNEVSSKPRYNTYIYEEKESQISKIAFYLVNLIIYLGLIIILNLSFKNANIFMIILVITIFYFYFICFQQLFKKAGFPWQGIFIPIYGNYLKFKLGFDNGWTFLVMLISPILNFLGVRVMFIGGFEISRLLFGLSSIVNFLIPPSLLFCIGKKFGRSGIITVLFSFAVISMIAFSNKYEYERYW